MQKLSRNTLEEIIMSVLQNRPKIFVKVLNGPRIKRHDGKLCDKWFTDDGRPSESVLHVMQGSCQFQSLGNMTYNSLYAPEGGISIPIHKFMREWIDFNHYFLNGNGTIINECRGYNQYHTGKDVTAEELSVMVEILKVQGVQVEIFKK